MIEPNPPARKALWMKVIDRKQLAKLMTIQGVSTRGLATAAGYGSHAYLGRILRGEVNTLKVEPACLIADYFGVGVDDLFMVQTSSETARIAARAATDRRAS